jgi:formamidopyrimidine-DNA glycosylase
MPELPEVETIIRFLVTGANGGIPVIGKRIESADVLWERSLANISKNDFIKRINNQVIDSVRRRAKFIVFDLPNGVMIVHLRMSGDLRAEPINNGNAQLLPHDRAVFYLAGESRLVFNDTRKFGRIWLTEDEQSILGGLGPEPLDPGFTPIDFHRRLSGSRRQVKPLLMDQSFLAGLGNIYTDESLHDAGIHPLQPSDELSLTQADRLLGSIRSVLSEGIRRNGASIDWVYRGGSFQNSFRVYQRTGKPCLTCGTLIERITVGQRGTHYCPVCQTLPNNE